MSKLQLYTHTLVKKYGITQREADEFASAMFDVIKEYIQKEQIVKVKGLGTFKLAEQSARESINVNTGERILIEGRSKLSFTPENSVKDRINAPFIGFESIDIPDEVDFSEIDTKYQESTDVTEDTVSPINVAQEIPVVPDLPEKEEVEDTSEKNTPEETPVAPVTPPLSEEVKEETENPIEEEPSVEDNAVEEFISESLVKEESKNIEPTSEEAPAEEEQPLSQTTLDNIAKYKLDKRDEAALAGERVCEALLTKELHRSNNIIRSLVAAIILLVISFGGYIAFTLLHPYFNGYNKPLVVAEKNVKPVEAPQPTKVVATDSLKETRDTLVTKKVVAEQPKPQLKENADSLKQIEYNKDARVRTGAYVIVGVDRTVLVGAGQTLSSISRAYLGPDMECYVEVLNNKKSVQPGESLQIPKLVLKKRLRKK